MKVVCSMIAFLLLALPLWAQQFFKIEGTVVEAGTGKAVSFASVGVAGEGIGTACNENGQFVLKVPEHLKTKSLQVSALGFKPYKKTLAQLQGQKVLLQLEPAEIKLPEVAVSAQSAEEIVRRSIERIPVNYNIKPVFYTAFHRKSEVLNNQPTYIQELVSDAYLDKKKETH
ncbi:MAG: carboxypeptidase-like regulatory domain-containing protein, partial [Hymenobacteraceae bacterium]|nr:carboxypeptidase-like regulatory domain-containing protein [Hymenobacteraceae bacterium]MDX5396131.1 carboxypeptidase-like regulatory domain-containing protein [Hymenobacteraceae bacterium]MDX5512192.1 carboxypeptidase-like regulatory domain-containing protein [Hymenobacteraceae bacterium]